MNSSKRRKYNFIVIEPKQEKFSHLPFGTFMYIFDSQYNGWERRMYLDPGQKYWKQITDGDSPTLWFKSINDIVQLYNVSYRIKKYLNKSDIYAKRFEEFC